MSINWGSVPDYFAGLGAVAALFWARKAAKAARAANDRQDQQLALIREDKLREQASQVAVWSLLLDDGMIKPFVLNASSLPVYDLWVFVSWSGSVSGIAHAEIQPPTASPESFIDEASFTEEVFDPRTTRNISPLETSYCFRDSNGGYWRRKNSLDLESLSGERFDVYVQESRNEMRRAETKKRGR